MATATTTTTSETAPTMQLAHLLSDLTSLLVCDRAAALALVSARSDSTSQTASSSASASASAAAPTPSSSSGPADAASDDVDLARAKDLVELHYSVKEAHRRGELTRGLFEARAAVERAVGG